MGKVYDEETNQVIPAKLEFSTIMGESKVDVNANESGYSTKLDRDGVCTVKVSAKGY